MNQIEQFRNAASEPGAALSIKLPYMTDDEFVSVLCKGVTGSFAELSLRALAADAGTPGAGMLQSFSR